MAGVFIRHSRRLTSRNARRLSEMARPPAQETNFAAMSSHRRLQCCCDGKPFLNPSRSRRRGYRGARSPHRRPQRRRRGCARADAALSPLPAGRWAHADMGATGLLSGRTSTPVPATAGIIAPGTSATRSLRAGQGASRRAVHPLSGRRLGARALSLDLGGLPHRRTLGRPVAVELRRLTKLDGTRTALEHDDFSSSCHPALASCWSMIFSENRYHFWDTNTPSCRSGRSSARTSARWRTACRRAGRPANRPPGSAGTVRDWRPARCRPSGAIPDRPPSASAP